MIAMDKELKKKLKPFGKVKVCEAVLDKFIGRIEEGFDYNTLNTLKVLKIINEHLSEYKYIHKIVTAENYFEYIIKKS